MSVKGPDNFYKMKRKRREYPRLGWVEMVTASEETVGFLSAT
jgi:hypothetical protein